MRTERHAPLIDSYEAFAKKRWSLYTFSTLLVSTLSIANNTHNIKEGGCLEGLEAFRSYLCLWQTLLSHVGVKGVLRYRDGETTAPKTVNPGKKIQLPWLI